MTDERKLVTWKELKAMGWPYSRQHTMRMIRAERFPEPIKFGPQPGSRIAWRWPQVQPYFE